MRRLFSFIKKEAVLCIASIAAMISMLAVPPDAAYGSYIDYSTLATLFSLMLVVAGLTSAGMFRVLISVLTRHVTSPRILILALTLTCFLLSALITNDVALITFVPFTIGLLGTSDHRRLIWTVVTETVAANLGSLLTPMGNPQNLFLYHYYDYTAPAFLREMFPLALLSLGCCLILAFAVPRGTALTQVQAMGENDWHCRRAILWSVAFFLCVFCVAGFVPWWLCLALTSLVALCTERNLFVKVDYSLLLTFVSFFIFVGNVARIEPVSHWIRALLSGREMFVGALVSQVISNVPAAAMLAPFTEEAHALLYGVNIGGLGTLIASMASLISYRRYTAVEGALRGKYMAVFSVVNIALLLLLLMISALWLT